MSDEHHTPEQVKKAFAYAPVVLEKLKDAGVTFPSFRLFADGSGSLNLGQKITNEQFALASELVRSRRQSFLTGDNTIDFCCGLVTAAEEAS